MTIETRDVKTPLETYRTDHTEDDDGFWSGVGTVVDQVNLTYGEDIAEESRASEFKKFVDYEENQKFYEAYGDTTAWYLHESTEEGRRAQLEEHIDSGRFTLINGEVNDSSGELNTWLYDRDSIKGAILAKQNGWNPTKAKTAYREYATAKGQDIQERIESQDIGLGQLALGLIAGHGAQGETFFEVAASPTKIIGQTIAKGAMKAFAIEGGIVALGEMGREYRIAKHKELMGEEYGLWDSAKNVMLAAGIGGVFRATGSAVVDYQAVKAIRARGVGAIAKELEKKGVPIEEAKLQEEIVGRFFRREASMLTNNTTKHIDMMHKAERDIDNGKPVDVAKHTELSVEDKVKELEPESDIDEIAENSLEAEVKNSTEMQKTDIETKEVEKTVDEAKPYNPEMKDDPFEGSATKQEGEVRIEEAGNKAEYDEVQAKIDALEKPLSERQQQIKEASVPKIGGSEEEAKQAVKSMFKKTDDQYKAMNKADIAEQDRMYQADLDMEANAVFAKFGDNLAVGTIAGVEEDEQGNITFNPEMFVAGLGGYTALKAMAKSKTLRKEIGDSLTRKFNDLDDNPLFNALVGKQQAIDGRFKSDGLSKLAQKQADEMGLTPEDLADFDADDFQYLNKASRMIDNMDIQAKKEGIPDLPYEARPTEDIAKEIEEWSPAQAKESTYKEGDTVTAEVDPTITPYAKAVIKKNDKPIVKAAKKKLEPKLYATHRTSINNLSKMLDEGVLPAPSFALAKSSKVSEQFGDIIMIPKEKHIDPKKGAYAFGGDAWTPRIKFDANEEMEIMDLKAPIFDMFPGFKSLAKNAYDKDDFYNHILNEEKYVNWLDKYGKNRGFDTYESAQRVTDQIFKLEKPSLKKKIAQIKKLIKDNGGDILGLESAFTPSYVDHYKQYFNLEDVAKRGKELKTFRDKDKFYTEAEKAIAKGEQPPADYMEAKRIDLVSLEDLDRIVVPSDQYNEVVKMFEEKGIKVDIIKQRKGESTNSAIKRSSSGKGNFIWGGATVGLIPLFDKEDN